MRRRSLDVSIELTPDQRRLQRFIWLDVATTLTAVVVIALTYAFVARTGWLVVLGAGVFVAGGVMWSALTPLGRGGIGVAVRRMAVANWSVALFTVVVAPFQWPLQLLTALLPVVIAAPHAAGRVLRRYVAVSLAISVTVAALGLLQDVSGFQDEVPSWSRTAIVLFFTPFMGAMVVLSALQYGVRLRDALDETLRANEALTASRRRIVIATDRERRRVERDIHDGAQQRLTALRLDLRLAEERCRTAPEDLGRVFGGLRDQVQAAHDELRRLAHGVYPTVLTQHGLDDALRSAADRCPIAVEVDVAVGDRHDADVEAAVYFCCAEALHNAAVHAGAAASVQLRAGAEDGRVRVRVEDDGPGFDPDGLAAQHGLDNLADRMHAVGGELAVEAAPGTGTTITGSVPI